MGVVYEAYDLERGVRIALKTLQTLDAEAIYRFKQEFRSLTEILHPNLLPLYELVSDGEQWFFTMELIVDAVDFYSYIRTPVDTLSNAGSPTTDHPLRGLAETTDEFPVDDAPLPPTIYHECEPIEAPSLSSQPTMAKGRKNVSKAGSDAVPSSRRGSGLSDADFHRLRNALRQLTDGVCALHNAGKLHRDLKPANVLVRRDGGVVLLDFGLVADLMVEPQQFAMDSAPDDGQLTASKRSHHATEGLISGTVGFMAPEQAAGGVLTTASDWYAVGVMLFHVLTGELPFNGLASVVLRQKRSQEAPAPADLVAGIPPELNALCVDLLKRDPDARPTGSDILARLASETAVGAPAGKSGTPSELMPFVGREEHLAVLHDAFREMTSGAAVVYRVHGRSGAGKSTLIQYFLDDIARRSNVVILAGRCYEQESVPYKAVDSLVDALTRYLVGLDRGEVKAFMPPHVGALARVFPVLQRVAAVNEVAAQEPKVPDLRELRRRAFNALRELLARIGERHPLTLYIDDLQWGDVDSAALLSDLLEPPNPPRMLLLMSYRSEYADTSPCLAALKTMQTAERSAEELVVDALLPDETRALVQKLLGDSPERRSQAATIVEESRGSPLFVYELVRHVKDGGQLSADTAGLELDNVLWSRVTQLPGDTQRFLEVIATAGQPIRIRDAQRAAGLKSLAPEMLTRLRVGHLVRSTGPRLEDHIESFHDRIRESVTAHLTPESRKGHHANLAAALESSGDADAETVAVHFHKSDQHEKAGSYYARAADEAANALAFDRAAKLYDLSVNLRPALGVEGRLLRTKYGDALANAGRAKLAADQYLLAADKSQKLEQIDLERKAAYQLCASGHLDGGREVLRRVLGRVGMQLPNSQFKALLLLLWRRFRIRLRGIGYKKKSLSQVSAEELARIDVTWSAAAGMGTKNIIIAPAFQTQNLLLALNAGEPFRIARALSWEAAQTAHDGVGAMPTSRKLIDGAARIAKELNDPYVDGMVELAEGVCAFLTGRWQTGSQRCTHAARIFRERCTGTSWELGQANTYMLWCMSWEGRFGEMAKRTAEILEDATDKGDLFTAANLGTYMAPLSDLTADDIDAARLHLSESLSHWSREEYNIQNMTALMGAVPVHLYAKEYHQAYRRIVDEWRDLQRSLILKAQICSVVLPELRVRSALAVAAHGDRDPALIRDAKRFLKKMERTRVNYATALAAPLRAGLANLEGNRHQAIEGLEYAVRALDEVHMGLFAASSRFRLGQLLGGEKGGALMAEAIDWLQKVGVKNPTAMIGAYTPYFRDG